MTISWSRICCIPSFPLNSCFFTLHTFCVMWRRVTQKTFRFIWISPSLGSLVFFFPWNTHVQNQQWHTLGLRAKSPIHPVILWVHGTFKNKQGPAGHTRLHSDGERNGKPGKRMQEMKDTGRETVSQCPSGSGCDPFCFNGVFVFNVDVKNVSQYSKQLDGKLTALLFILTVVYFHNSGMKKKSPKASCQEMENVPVSLVCLAITWISVLICCNFCILVFL